MLTFLLVPAVVLAVGVLATVTFRTSFQLEKLREQSVVEATLSLANEKADRLDKLIVEQDDAVASDVNIGDLSTLTQRWLKGAAPGMSPAAGFTSGRVSGIARGDGTITLDRFADLKVVYAESQVGWMPYLLERADIVFELPAASTPSR